MKIFGISLGSQPTPQPPAPQPVGQPPIEQALIPPDLVAELTARVEEMSAKIDGAKTIDSAFLSLIALPVKAGRSSYPDVLGGSMVGGGMQEVLLTPLWNIEAISMLEFLSIYHGDVSYAVENVVSLANTRYSISYADDVKPTAAKEMTLWLRDNERSWYAFSSGTHSLVADLLFQMFTTGAASAEAVPARTLDNLEKIVLVDPKNIRFVWSPSENRYMPRQRVPLLSGTDSHGLLPLNEQTYRYVSKNRLSSSPYAIPPMLSALEGLQIERPMFQNFKSIMKRMGMLGLLTALVPPPTALPGEQTPEYELRKEAYLLRVAQEMEKTASKGVAVGFKDQADFKLFSPASESKGAETLMKLADQKVMSGLKQDPAMLGRQFSTSETFGRVMLAKLANQVVAYQQAVAEVLGHAYELALVLAGFQPGRVYVEFERPMITDQLKDQQAFSMQIDNAVKLRDEGIIDQQQAAVLLGYEKPAEEEAPKKAAPPMPPGTGDGDGEEGDEPGNPNPDATDTDEKTTGQNSRTAAYRLTRGSDPFDYGGEECGCGGHHAESWAAFDGRRVQTLLKKYTGDVTAVFTKAVDEASRKVADRLSGMDAAATLESVQEAALMTLFTYWADKVPARLQKVTSRHAGDIYREFRGDQTVFSASRRAGESFTDPPAVVLDLLDERAIEFFKAHDLAFLSKFITDPDTRNRLLKMIREMYLESDTPIGNNPEAFAKFRAAFEDALVKEDWKLRRIIDTTVNRMRAYASVNYMHQAEVERFTIQGVSDSRQCMWCQNLQGKVFEVAAARDKISRVVDADVDSIGVVAPFATSQFKPDDLKSMDGAALQASGIDTPPFHPHCRDSVIALF